MSKLKTKRAAAKRFRLPGPARRAGLPTIVTGDRPAREAKVEQRKPALVAPADVRMVKRMLPYGS